MHTLFKPILIFVASAALATASTLPAILEPRTCSKLILPKKFYGISTTALDSSFDYGPHQPPSDPFFDFKFSQTSNGAQGLSEENDLIATYTGLPCKASQSYNLEFSFEPISDYSYNGDTRVDVWRVDGTIQGSPTWNKLKNFGLIYVGGFKMPGSASEQVRKVFQIGSFACKSEINFRVSITNNPTPPKTGSTWYVQEYAGAIDTGLRIRYSC